MGRCDIPCESTDTSSSYFPHLYSHSDKYKYLEATIQGTFVQLCGRFPLIKSGDGYYLSNNQGTSIDFDLLSDIVTLSRDEYITKVDEWQQRSLRTQSDDDEPI